MDRKKWRAVIEVETAEDVEQLDYSTLEHALDFGDLTVVEARVVE